MGRYENFRAVLEAQNCAILTEKSAFTAGGELSFKCEVGHVRAMTAAAFNNKVAKIKRGENKACALCEVVGKATAELDALGHEMVEYVNVVDVRFRCGNCGEESHSNMAALRKGTGVCIKCMNRERRSDFGTVAKECEAIGFELLSYEGNKAIRARCPCGGVFEGALWDLKRGRKCRECAGTRRAQTNVIRYGAENPFASEEIKHKIVQKHRDTLGVDYPQQNPEVRKRTQATNVEKYGYKYAMNQPEVYAKIRATHTKLYGVPFPLQSELIQGKIEEASLKKYGVRRPLQHLEYFEAFKKTCMKRKLYTFPSGCQATVQGYEPIAIDYLLKTYREEDIRCENVPSIPYVYEGKERVYHPDLMVVSENCLIEVKSPYTLYANFDVNMAKFAAAKDSVYNFRLLVFEKANDIEPFEDFIFE
jgi:hypothetical protein